MEVTLKLTKEETRLLLKALVIATAQSVGNPRHGDSKTFDRLYDKIAEQQ